jgi:short-subunit dehydrogenase
VALTQRVLPGMRQRRGGHIVNSSSIGGLCAFAATGYHHMTKFAVEAFSESLSIEAGPLGIRVAIVEPGPFRTDWAGRSIVESPRTIADDGPTAGKRRGSTRASSGNQIGDPVRGAAAVVAAVESPDPPLRLLLGTPALKPAYARLDSLRANFDPWKQATLSADFPEKEKQGG